MRLEENLTEFDSRDFEYIKSFTEGYREEHGALPLCFVHSFGCQQNVSDGEKIKGALLLAGYELTKDVERAQLIIFNTCAVRENAEDKLYGVIGGLKKHKSAHPDTLVAVCGCMTQQQGAAAHIESVYKQVDILMGTYSRSLLYRSLAEALAKKSHVTHILPPTTAIEEDFYQLRESSFSAFVPIMYGCNNFCSYCVVPYVRGRERSRSLQAVTDEVRRLVAEGYKEIFLLGQNVNSYSYGFPKLLRELDAIEGDFWIRFMSSHPKDAGPELIDAIIDCKKVAKHLHLALQSGSDRVLQEMNRRYTKADYMSIVDYARSRVPDFSFSTDIIVGFPGESYEEFLETCEFVKKVKFDNIYSFVYSKRNGTAAAELDDPISTKQKGLWLRELLLEQREVSSRWLERFVGRSCRVLCDGVGKEEGTLTGKNSENIIVNFPGNEAMIGNFVTVKIKRAANWALFGDIAD